MTELASDLLDSPEPQTATIKVPKKRNKRLQTEFTPDELTCVTNAIAFSQVVSKQLGVLTPANRGKILASICRQWLDTQSNLIPGSATVEPVVPSNTSDDAKESPEDSEGSNPNGSQ